LEEAEDSFEAGWRMSVSVPIWGIGAEQSDGHP
jgi:hypothetical protein